MSATIDPAAGGAPRHGATPNEWHHFAFKLDLIGMLLPVVSNPLAKISLRSTMTALGKTPSRYDSARQVTGITKWTQHVSRAADIERWSREPDYGICLQTHVVRAIDVDIPDAELAAAVESLIVEQLGGRRLPRRERANSSNFLLAFQCVRGLAAEGFRKRIITLPSGDRIEFLANGQQFIAAGTHPSGARYEWRGGLPAEIPHLCTSEFESLWSALRESFGTEERVAGSSREQKPPGQHALSVDDLREMLQFVSGTTYDHWCSVLWALRSAWRESVSHELDEAAVLQLADAYSERGDTGKYPGGEAVRHKFEEGNGGISWRTLLKFARDGGWNPTVQQDQRINAGMFVDFDTYE
jgi:Bifunctional DNA primase/polymerase, N-terminal